MDDKKLLKIIKEENKLKDKDLILLVKRTRRNNIIHYLIMIILAFMVITLCNTWIPSLFIEEGYSFNYALIAWFISSYFYMFYYLILVLLLTWTYSFIDKLIHKKENEIIKKIKESI